MSDGVVRRVEESRETLSALSIQPSYRTGVDDLLADFYLPCLSHAIRYDRTTWYFDMKAFQLAADGFGRLIANGGQIRLIVSPRLRKRDITALTGSTGWSSERIQTVLESDVAAASLADWLRREPHGCLSWLVHTDVLEVKIAFLEPDSARPFSHYHEKLGVFTDSVGNAVAFSGSANETGLAWTGNFEAVDVFCSWIHADHPRVDEKVAAFETLWRNETPGVIVKPIKEAASDGIGAAHLWKSIKTALMRRI